jgi:hypothetical protein
MVGRRSLLSRRRSMICDRPSDAISFASVARSIAVIIAASLFIVTSMFSTQGLAQISAFGRSSAPMYGGTGRTTPPANPFSTTKNNSSNFAPMHTTIGGQPCISVHPREVPQIADPHIVNHVVLVDNVCGQSIKVQVCYFQRSSCIMVAVNGYQKLERILGISPGMTGFRYEYRELL